MPAKGTCAVCGKIVARNKTSLPQGKATCQPCKRATFAERHSPGVSHYQRGCRCDGCREANTVHCRKRRGGVAGTPRGGFQPVRACLVCNSRFSPAKHAERLCSTDCRAHQRRAQGSARRATLRAAIVERVIPARIFDRDGWRCHICRRKLSPATAFPHRRAATIDHLVPLSRGGAHEPANVKTACHACNAGKGNRGGNEQLLLIG